MKRTLQLVILSLIMALVLYGCGAGSQREYTVYYLNTDRTALVPVQVELKSDKLDDILDELIDIMSTDTNSVRYIRPIATDISVRECALSDGNLTIDFSAEYDRLQGEAEVLTRAAIAKTMLQIEGVDSVSFFVYGRPITDTSASLESFDEDSFVDDYGDATNFIGLREVSLYYATSDGESLYCEKKVIEVDERVAMADVVLDHLRKKPASAGVQVAIPKDARILSTTVSDGVCYVTLDSTLLTEKSDISNKAIIYSIVNSLCDSTDVKSVVIRMSNANDSAGQNYLDIAGTYVSDKSMVVDEY